MKLDYSGPHPVIISVSRSGRSSALDFLKVFRFSFPVLVVGPSAARSSALSLSFAAENIKKIFALVKKLELDLQASLCKHG